MAWMFLDPIISVPKDGAEILPTENNLPKEEVKNTIQSVSLAGKNIKVEIADTDAKRELGLSGHKLLTDEEGMLFVFEEASVYPFWMKDMLFPIDIIWLAQSEVEGIKKVKVIYIQKNAQPDSFPEAFGPDQNALYVLEVNAGFSDKNNLKIGDEVKF